MNLWRRFLNAVRWKPQQRVYTNQRQAGVTVTEDTAQAFSAVGACVRIISETMASLPWCVYRKLDTGREEVPSNPVAWLLGYQPNPEQTAMVWRRQLIAHYLLWGNGYAEIERGMDGRAVWLWPLLPDRCCIKRSETGALICEVTGPDGAKYVLPRENVFHVADGSFDGLMGLSRVQLARRAIGAGIAQDVFTASFYENGAAVGGVIEQKTGKTLSGEGSKALLKAFNDEYAGPARARKTLYLDAGMEWKQVDMPLTDAQFIESRRFQVEEICRWYGVPQHLVQMLTETNYAISYSADKNFVEHTLRPIATLMEQEANVRLFGARAQGSLYSRMNLRALMRGDPKVRGEWYKALINAGVMSINEVRELEELNSIGAEGDEHYLQTSMTTLGRIAAGTNITQSQPNAAPAAGDGTAATARAIGEAIGEALRNMKPPQVLATVNAGDVKVENHQPAPQVGVQVDNHVPVPSVEVKPANVHVEVAAPSVTVENNVEPTPVNVAAPKVTVEAPRVQVAAPQVTVAAPEVKIENRVEVPQVQETEQTVEYNEKNHIRKVRTRTIR